MLAILRKAFLNSFFVIFLIVCFIDIPYQKTRIYNPRNHSTSISRNSRQLELKVQRPIVEVEAPKSTEQSRDEKSRTNSEQSNVLFFNTKYIDTLYSLQFVRAESYSLVCNCRSAPFSQHLGSM